MAWALHQQHSLVSANMPAIGCTPVLSMQVWNANQTSFGNGTLESTVNTSYSILRAGGKSTLSAGKGFLNDNYNIIMTSWG